MGKNYQNRKIAIIENGSWGTYGWCENEKNSRKNEKYNSI